MEKKRYNYEITNCYSNERINGTTNASDRSLNRLKNICAKIHEENKSKEDGERFAVVGYVFERWDKTIVKINKDSWSRMS